MKMTLNVAVDPGVTIHALKHTFISDARTHGHTGCKCACKVPISFYILSDERMFMHA